MPNNRWEPKAQAIPSIWTNTIALTWALNDTITLTLNNKSMVITIGTLITTAQVATTLQQAFEGAAFTDSSASVAPVRGKAAIPEMAELTATVSGSAVTFAASVAGVSIIGFTSTQVTAGDGTSTQTETQTATGPNFYDNIDNFSLGSLPAAGEDIFVDNTVVSILYGLDASSVALLSFTQAQNFRGDIGLPERNGNGYEEYRGKYLQIDAATMLLGNGAGTGSRRIKIDSGSATANAITVENTGAPAEQGLPAVLWKGTNAGNSLEVHAGQVGIAAIGGESATLANVLLAGGNVEFGDGVTTISILTNRSATVSLRSDVTTFISSGGVVTIFGDAAFAIIICNGGNVDYRSSGTIDALFLGGPGGTLDCANDNTGRTITDTTLSAGGRINDPLQTITYTNGIQWGATTRALTAE